MADIINLSYSRSVSLYAYRRDLGIGLPRIINICKEYGLPDSPFEEFCDGFKVTIFR